MEIFETKQILFLGCSLGSDRIMDLYKEAKKRIRYMAMLLCDTGR